MNMQAMGYGGLFGGYNPSMYGGMSPYAMYNPYMGYGGMMGGYGSMFGNPYMMGGYGGYGYGGYSGGTDFMSEFEAKMQDMFDKYFAGKTPVEGTVETPAADTAASAEKPAATPPVKPEFKFGENFGQSYAKTGEFGAGGLAQIQKAGYKDEADFLANSGIGQGLQKKQDEIASNTNRADQTRRTSTRR